MVGSDHEWSWDKGFRPMTDIVERLRGRRRVVGSEIPRIAQMIKETRPEDMLAMVPESTLNEAADEIERLREAAEMMRLALQAPTKFELELRDEIERLTAALRDLIDRWSTERGYDGAIQRARALLLEHETR